MATTYTPNLDLPKHAITDPFDITLINEAMDKTDAAVAGKAPAGYGLGKSDVAMLKCATTVDELNTYKENGWFGYLNGSANLTDGFASSAVLIKADVINANYLTHAAKNILGDEIVRTCEGGVWKPWEWVNPPMLLGVEYRTTERHLGRVVYAKKCDLGYLPNANTKAVTGLATGVYEMVDDFLTIYSANNSYTRIPEVTSCYTAANGGTPYCSITTNADVSSYTAYLTIKYTKG